MCTGLQNKVLPRLCEIERCVFLLTAGRRTQFFHPKFTQSEKRLIMQPCNVHRDGSVMNRGPGCVIPHPRLPLAAGSSSRNPWTRQITRPCHPRCAIFYFKFFQCLKGLFIVGMGYFFRWREMGSYVQPIYMGDISISELYGPIVTRQIPCQW